MQVTCSGKQMGNELTEGAQATSYPQIWRDTIMQRQNIQGEVQRAESGAMQNAKLSMDLQASTAVL